VVGFDFDEREYTAKPRTTYSRAQTKIPEAAVVPPCRDGAAEMNNRGGQQSSEATKVINDLSRQIAKLTTGLEQAHVQIEREKKKSKVADAKVALGKKLLTTLQAEVAALSCGDPRDSRLSFRGRLVLEADE